MIHTLKHKGYSIRAIAKITGLDRRTISKRLKEEEMLPFKKKVYNSKLDIYKEYILKRYNECLPDTIPSSVIYKEIKEYGYEGSVRTVQRFLQLHRVSSTKKEELIRFETEPGFQGQVDWTVIRSGKNPIYGFVMVLGYSRMAYVYFTDNMTQSTWQECHIKAFEYFGGIPKTLLYDNLKSVVIKRDKYGKNLHGFNNEFVDFSKHRFIPKLCKPYRAKTKGKVERFNLYLKNNFYKPLRASLQTSGIVIDKDLLNSYIFKWLEFANSRIHYTTKQKPSDLLTKELPYLEKLDNGIKPCISNKLDKVPSSNNIKSSYPKDIDISYHTTLSDYESLIRSIHAS